MKGLSFFAVVAALAVCGCQVVAESGPPVGAGAPSLDGGSMSPTSDDAGPGPDAGAAVPVDAATIDAGPALVVSAGGQHTCAVASSGAVWCWGSNGQEQLGTTTAPGSLVPIAASAPAQEIAVAAGDSHTCALSAASAGGQVRCWGDDTHGQLGVTGLEVTPTAVHVPVTNATAVAAGGGHTCAIAGGEVWCWGDDTDGQLGNGATGDGVAPVRVAGLTNVTAIATGGAHTCALASGGVSCWGFNAYGQLGDGTTTTRTAPVAVFGLGAGVTAISAGNSHTCALLSAGDVQCWGFGSYGQLGNGAIANSSVPVRVVGLTAPTAIAAGGTHTCAIAQGGVWCWGDDQSGQLGDGAEADSPTPVAAVGLSSGASAIVAGTAHTCAIVGGAVQCWGWNVLGQLGCDSNTDSPTPVVTCGF